MALKYYLLWEIIVDFSEGGRLLHSSIIARELEIPSINEASKAKNLIKFGDLITVNGDLT